MSNMSIASIWGVSKERSQIVIKLLLLTGSLIDVNNVNAYRNKLDEGK